MGGFHEWQLGNILNLWAKIKKMVRLEGETLNTITELMEVFEDWDAQLRDSEFQRLQETDQVNELQHDAPEDFEPGGMS